MIRKLALLVTSLAWLLPSAAVLAQDQPPPGQLWSLHQETVKPSMVAQYEAATREFAAAAAKHRPAGSDFSAVALASENFVYTYAVRIRDWNGIGGIEQTLMAIAKSMGMDKWTDLWKRGFAPVESVREVVAFEPADLGYKPANPRLKDEELVFFHYDYYYVMPGHEDEAAGVARDFTALFKKKNIPDGYRLFKGVSGPELPLIVVQVGARDGADYYASNAKALAALGEEGQALFARAFAITRRFDSHNAKLRLDLSVLPPAAKAAK
ncbi:MAG TPA: hypothetical protein VHR45_07290 [Thermoanaerobaculia bacterium]|nr:hypothetical protein [Thermoanaerobaculia bacterium]